MNTIQIEADVVTTEVEQSAGSEAVSVALKTLNDLELTLVGGGSGDVIF
ncbi:MAG: hypothetical protein JNM76_11335 [Betaproteobacteria bacterium]|nr:hypothetical protein [Betaproteobacteria bacterium]